MACSPTMSPRPLADTQHRSVGVPESHCVTIGIPGQASDTARGCQPPVTDQAISNSGLCRN
jgi:hypothetical protein